MGSKRHYPGLLLERSIILFLKDYNNRVHFLKKAEYAHPSVLEIKYFLAETFLRCRIYKKQKQNIEPWSATPNLKSLVYMG